LRGISAAPEHAAQLFGHGFRIFRIISLAGFHPVVKLADFRIGKLFEADA